MANGNASAVPSTGNPTGPSTTNVPAGNSTGQSTTANTTTTTSSGTAGAVDQGASSGQILDWEDVDRFSFEDSDHFEEDSLCSWSSEPESLCNNWRGWRRPTAGFTTIKKSSEGMKES
ncbi:PREDICTED: uncharacterized protein LOC106787461 isoform X2 [Polistes canadensis]|uniref:uncharacterized protein LOC106787461 isoform X2 n=1 Tax=Polistes canadensis TaxID=91411 RepID=UPI000718CA07|nr:PREDICTED: uncharacterized protein LOC106787461 isoform X2 [Polistes canadensis]